MEKSTKDLDLNNPDDLIEFHERVVVKTCWAKKKPAGIWSDDSRYSKDHYHYWRSRRTLEKLLKKKNQERT